MSIVTKSNLRKSGYIFSLMIIIIFVIFPFLIHSKFNIAALIFSCLIFVISSAKPFILRKPYLIWIKIGNLLGEFNSRIILGVFFYILITPFSIIRNICKFLFFKKYNKNSFYKKGNKNMSNFKDQF